MGVLGLDWEGGEEGLRSVQMACWKPFTRLPRALCSSEDLEARRAARVFLSLKTRAFSAMM